MKKVIKLGMVVHILSPAIRAGGLRKEDCLNPGFKAILGNIVRPCPKNKTKQKKL